MVVNVVTFYAGPHVALARDVVAYTPNPNPNSNPTLTLTLTLTLGHPNPNSDPNLTLPNPTQPYFYPYTPNQVRTLRSVFGQVRCFVDRPPHLIPDVPTNLVTYASDAPLAFAPPRGMRDQP